MASRDKYGEEGVVGSLTCRLMPTADADGPRNMALDEALLDSAATRGVASLRLYGWSAPTLSLGYFQPAGPARAFPGLGELPWLRRPSGGAALVHHHELTYALALPPGKEWQGGPPWLLRFHRVVAAALAALGVEARPCAEGESVKLGEVLCFLHHTPGDLLVGRSKIVGSAQRKTHGALLQHGGILLAQSPHTSSLPGIAELARCVSVDDLGPALLKRFRRDTGWELSADSWTEGEMRFADDAVAQRYASPRWNERR